MFRNTSQFIFTNTHTKRLKHRVMLTPLNNFSVNNVLTDKQMCDSSKSIMPGKLHMKHASQTHLNGHHTEGSVFKPELHPFECEQAC